MFWVKLIKEEALRRQLHPWSMKEPKKLKSSVSFENDRHIIRATGEQNRARGMGFGESHRADHESIGNQLSTYTMLGLAEVGFVHRQERSQRNS